MIKNTVVEANKNFNSQEARFNQAFENFIKAEERMGTCKSGKASKVAHMQLVNAKKQLAKIDSEFAATLFANIEKEEKSKGFVKMQVSYNNPIYYSSQAAFEARSKNHPAYLPR